MMKALRTIIRASRDVRDHFAAEHVALFPFVGPLRRYDLGKLRLDSHAAVNVTLLAVSQAIAFAAIAGLPVVYGVLCTAVAASFGHVGRILWWVTGSAPGLRPAARARRGAGC